MSKNPHAVALGKRGGAAKSEKKAAAARENGKKGGRPLSLTPIEEEIILAAVRSGVTTVESLCDSLLELYAAGSALQKNPKKLKAINDAIWKDIFPKA